MWFRNLTFCCWNFPRLFIVLFFYQNGKLSLQDFTQFFNDLILRFGSLGIFIIFWCLLLPWISWLNWENGIKRLFGLSELEGYVGVIIHPEDFRLLKIWHLINHKLIWFDCPLRGLWVLSALTEMVVVVKHILTNNVGEYDTWRIWTIWSTNISYRNHPSLFHHKWSHRWHNLVLPMVFLMASPRSYEGVCRMSQNLNHWI